MSRLFAEFQELRFKVDELERIVTKLEGSEVTLDQIIEDAKQALATREQRDTEEKEKEKKEEKPDA